MGGYLCVGNPEGFSPRVVFIDTLTFREFRDKPTEQKNKKECEEKREFVVIVVDRYLLVHRYKIVVFLCF